MITGPYLVNSDWANFKVLLTHENFDWPLARDIVLEQILTLSALEQTAEIHQHHERFNICKTNDTYPHSGSLLL